MASKRNEWRGISKNAAGGNGTQAAILDGPDRRLLADVNVNEPAFWRRLLLNADVFKISGIPYRVKVSLQGSFVVNVAFTSENLGLDGFRGNSTIAVNLNLLYDLAALGSRQRTWGQQQENTGEE